MKTTLRTLLTLVALSICVIQGTWARIAPTLPESQTIESGKTYYLYNVMENKFLCRSTTGSYYAGLGMYGDKVLITATEEDNGYTIKWADNNYFLIAYDTYIYSTDSPGSWHDYFIVSESSKGYTIQRSPKNTSYYKADEFVGYDGTNGDRLTPALAEGSIHWVLYSAEDAEHYMAKHKLFTNLEIADQYNFYITQYNAVYDNPASTTEELDQAQSTLANALEISGNYVSPSWTEYPILFQNSTENKWELNGNKSQLQWYLYKNNSALETSSTLKATVNIDNNATLVYKYRANNYATMQVYVDGEFVQTISSNNSLNERRYYIELKPGKHDIAWTCFYNNASTWSGSECHYLSEIGIQNTPTITPATTTVEGQLGTEVLKLIDPVSSVKKIVINGIIGSDDWTTIGLMVNAFSIDMSGATATAPMPARMFAGSKFPFLYDVKLPQGLTGIGERAFYESDVENEMTFPSSMKTIGKYAFYNSKIKAAYMNDGISSIGLYAFYDCKYLENVTYPSKAVNIPDQCFQNCNSLRTFEIPENISSIGQSSFSNCWLFNARFPKTMRTIKYSAFYNTATDSLFVTEDMTVNSHAFDNCQNLVYAEWPTSFTYANFDYGNSSGTSAIASNCPKLNKVKLMSPTVVVYDSPRFFEGNTLGNITLQVPDFLVSAYKLDPYWYQCKVEGFNSSDITDWNIRQPLVLNPGQRINGTPNLNVRYEGNITINGDDVQEIKDLSIDFSPIRFYNNGNIDQQWGMMLGNSNNTNIIGNLQEWVLTSEKTWYFITLPFDTKVGDIETHSYENSQATSYAIRYYDGANRALNGAGDNWKNYSKDDIIPAGTGFIFQTAKDAYSKFTAQNNASKQYILSNNEFKKSLAANPSEIAANKGWNLVGNPWQTYYNIHKMNFTAPITVWDMDNKKYVAYSIIDDDYAIKPLEAIFVQCPDEIKEISFPIDGRQLTAEIESQNGARAANRGITQTTGERKLIDVELSNGEQTDKTRFVMNPVASMDYELSRDASKFFSMDASVPQIYTITNDGPLAIDERPLGDGTEKIGIKVAQSGEYTISSPRCQFQNIVLVDNETGIETDLANDGSYTFTTDAGTNESRFMLRVGGSVVTNINAIQSKQSGEKIYYNLNGQRVSNPQNGIFVVDGKKTVIK